MKLIMKRNLFFTMWLVAIFFFTGCASIQEAESLYNKGDKEAALNMAISLLDKDDPGIRLLAVRLIGKVGGEKAGSALRMKIRDSDSKVQKEVVKLSNSATGDAARQKTLSPGIIHVELGPA